ncbi:MAG: hypothetical protein ABWY00_17920, partial [Dongiaceae bacterium]
MTTFLFPGQGAQVAGFLHDLPRDPAVTATLEEASQILERDVFGLDSAEELASTVAVQLTALVAGTA